MAQPASSTYNRVMPLTRPKPAANTTDPMAAEARLSPGHDALHDHDHGACVADALARIERLCAERGARLTPLRRRVLEALADSHVPLGAYEIVDRLGTSGERPPPMSVYRTLDFLVAEGLAHRVESRNAYIACGHEHDPDDVVVFLICDACGQTAEVGSHAVGRDLAWAARAAGFTPRASVIEIPGECARCARAAAPAPVTEDAS